MAVLRLFAAAREAAGTARDEIAGGTVGDVLDAAAARYGDAFAAVLATCKVWRNGEPADRDDAVGDADEVAVLPPVSGGSTCWPGAGPSRRRPVGAGDWPSSTTSSRPTSASASPGSSWCWGR
jgi:molybdopterin converting factor small subunit